MAKKSKTPKTPAPKSPKAKSIETLNETGRRAKNCRREKEQPVSVDRRKGHRRRQIDPTTCERDYSEREIEFMRAMDEYKRLSGRMFPTCSEILEVIEKLGYRQIADSQEIYDPEENSKSGSSDDENLDSLEQEQFV